ncbi:MAG: aminotransferase [Chloroflexota bacterium]
MSTTGATTIADMDRNSLMHPFTHIASHLDTGPKVMQKSNGIYVTDNQSKEYIDGISGLWCVNAGWGRHEIIDAITEQAHQMAYYHSFSSMGNEPSIQLADKLVPIAPGNMSHVFFGQSGSDANDTIIKLVWYYNNVLGRPEKKKIISRWRSYHGVTIAVAGLTGMASVHNGFDVPLPFIRHVSTPYYYRNAEAGMSEEEYSAHLADELEQLILDEGPDTVGAFIAEPMIGSGGVITPPKGYFQAIQAVLCKYDVLMIADEVICGFGRCGTMFGSESFGITPDLVSIAKGMTSGYMPMSGAFVSNEIWDVMVEGSPSFGAFAHGYTHSGHPMSAAAALANLAIFERENLVEKSATMGAYLHRRMREEFADRPYVGDVRGKGMAVAVEFVVDKATKEPFDLNLALAGKMAAFCMEEGLIARALPYLTAISLAPPLVMTEAECDEMLSRFGRALIRWEASLSN